MDQPTENKQSEKNQKGLSQRKSYATIVEHEKSEGSQGVMMSRQGSRSSINTSSTASTEGNPSKDSNQDNKIPGQPINFGTVVPGVYRSSYPQEADYPFLQKLGLKTIITLVDKDMPETFVPFMKDSNIQHRQILMGGTKKETIPIETMSSILEVIHDKRNQPILIHCNQGKHRTGCVVGITRMLQQWDTERIVDEYKSYAFPKIRDGDVEYIRKFSLSDLAHLDFARPAAQPAAAVTRPAKKQSGALPLAVAGPQPLARPHKGRLLIIAVIVIFMWQSLEHLTNQRIPRAH